MCLGAAIADGEAQRRETSLAKRSATGDLLNKQAKPSYAAWVRYQGKRVIIKNKY